MGAGIGLLLLALGLQLVWLSGTARPQIDGRNAARPAEAAGLPRIGVTDSILYMEAEYSGPIPPATTFTIFNATEVGVLNWSIFEDRYWFASSPPVGYRNETEVQVWLVSTDLSLGQHSGNLVIFSTNAVNSPETVTVILEVLCPIAETGDANGDGKLSQSDIIYLVNHLLKAGPAPTPVPEAGDVNCDGTLALGDVIYLVNFLLKAGPSPCNACSLLP
jgi:hypothetical protein